MSLLLLDSASLYYRAYYALPESLTAPNGMPINAVRGFLDTVTAVVLNRRTTRVVACWDEDWRPAWRVELMPSYKAHRVGAPPGAGPGGGGAAPPGVPPPRGPPG